MAKPRNCRGRFHELFPRCGGTPRTPANQRSVSGVGGFPRRVGRHRPRGPPFSSPVRRSCRGTKEFIVCRWDPILPGCRWLHEPQPISDLPVGLGFPHRAGWYRPSKPPCSFPVRRRYRGMEGFLIRGWSLILPGWWCLHDPQPISDQPVGLGVPHRAGRYRPEGPTFLFPVCWCCSRVMEGFRIRRWGVILRECGRTMAFPRGATLAARPAPPHWSTNGIGARKTLDFDAFAYSTRYSLGNPRFTKGGYKQNS